jgi:dephospho-CoA kinase
LKPKRSHILKIGVTGGIGSGKTSVCRIFESLGIPVLYADDIAKKISNYDPNVRRRITRLLGPAAYGPEGLYNREFVASKIFSDKKLQQRLNAIIHPEVEKELQRRFQDAEQKNAKMVVVEAALIYEAGLDKQLDAVIVVDAGEGERIRRIVERDGATEKDIRKRMSAQWAVSKKIAKAEYVIHNNGTHQDLEHKVRFLHAVFENL